MIINNVSQTEIDKFNHHDNHWWDRDGDFRPLHDLNPTRLGFITHHVHLDGCDVLDVGCGGGIVSEGLAKRHANVIGLDLAEHALSIARQHAQQSGLTIDYRCQSVESLSLERPASFDVITCLEMLEHVPNPAAIVQACATLLKPGGHLFFSTLNKTLKSRVLGVFAAEYLLRLLPKGTHDYDKFIRPSQLAEMCENSGLSVHKIQGLQYNPFTRRSYLNQDVSINYLLYAQK